MAKLFSSKSMENSKCNTDLPLTSIYLLSFNKAALLFTLTTNTSLHNQFQCLTTVTVETFSFISSLNLPSLSLKPSPLSCCHRPCWRVCPLLSCRIIESPRLEKTSKIIQFNCPPITNSSHYNQLLFRNWKAAIRSPQNLLFSRLNSLTLYTKKTFGFLNELLIYRNGIKQNCIHSVCEICIHPKSLSVSGEVSNVDSLATFEW